MVRVLDVTEFYSMRGGGIRSHLENKSHVLCQRSVSHKIVAPGAKDERLPLGEWGELEFLRGPQVPYDPTYHLLWRPDRVAAAVREFRPDVVEVHSAYVAAFGALLARPDRGGIRTLVWHSDHVGTYVEPWLRAHLGAGGPRLAAPLWSAIARLTEQFSATFVASRTQLEALREHGAKRVEWLPFGVDRTLFRPRPPRAAVGPRRVVAAGRMAVEKRWDVVLRAFADAAHDRPEWRLLALGDGPERPALEQLARRLLPADRVEFVGFVRERERYAEHLRAAEVFLHACPHETYGLAVAEALASGLVAVVPDRGATAEWADGARVRAFRSGEPADAAAHLRDLLELPDDARDALPMPVVPSVTDHFDRLLARYGELLAAAR